MSIPDIVGMVGVVSCLLAYAGQQLGRWQADDLRYLGLNILAPACFLFSLAHNFNLAAVTTQVLWLCLTVLGLVRSLYARGKQAPVRRP